VIRESLYLETEGVHDLTPLNDPAGLETRSYASAIDLSDPSITELPPPPSIRRPWGLLHQEPDRWSRSPQSFPDRLTIRERASGTDTRPDPVRSPAAGRLRASLSREEGPRDAAAVSTATRRREQDKPNPRRRYRHSRRVASHARGWTPICICIERNGTQQTWYTPT
jgi:hypothetical protein